MVEILIRYLGIKTKLLSYIKHTVNNITSAEEGVLDLFAGSNSVAQFLMQDHPVYTNDYQKYSQVAAKALIEFHEHEIINALSEDKVFGEYYKKNNEELLRIFSEPLSVEKKLLEDVADKYTGKIFDDFADFFNNSPYVGHTQNKHKSFNNCLKYFSSEYLNDYKRNNKKFPYLLFTTSFNNPYFSLAQCIEIDNIKYSIDSLLDNNEITTEEYYIYLSFLVYSLNLIVISVGDHFAQPQKIKPVTSDFSNPRDKINIRERKKIILKKNIDVKELFLEKLEEYKKAYIPGRESNHAFCMNAIDLLKSSELDTINIKTVYIDPPYTNAHYSRFYHIPETLCLYDYPDIEFMGRYRTDRYQSNFCIKTQAYNEFVEMLTLCKKRNMNSVISYSNTEQCILKIEDLINICNTVYGKDKVQVNNIEHLYRNFGQKPNKILAREYLITCLA